MSRYIDAEIYEDKLAEYCKANCKYTEKEREYMCGACDVGNAIEMLDRTPTADVVEVVRCKDCKLRDDDGLCNRFKWVDFDGAKWQPNEMGYCHTAEKRSERKKTD